MHQRIVIKLGTSVLTGGTSRLDRGHMVEIARQCAVLRREGCEVIVVTSGAIAAGRERLGHPTRPPTVAAKQMLAAVGQGWLMHVWETLFDLYGIHVGQMLLTRADVADRGRFLNARDMLAALLEHDIVPIVNENDAVAVEEIVYGDNDNLSAIVAKLVGASKLIILTDIDGLFDSNPKTNKDARLISEVKAITPEITALAKDSGSDLGTGGMITKLQAAKLACGSGIDTYVVNGHPVDNIYRVLEGNNPGTWFKAVKKHVE